MKVPNPLGTIENTRTPEQRSHMEETIGKGKCPFCDLDKKLNIPLRHTIHWNIWKNPFPYPNHKEHIVIAPGRHVTDINFLSNEEWIELLQLICWAINKYDLKGGGVVMRFGEPKYNAGTLNHLHVQIQAPDGEHTSIAVFGKGPALRPMIKLLIEEKWQTTV